MIICYHHCRRDYAAALVCLLVGLNVTIGFPHILENPGKSLIYFSNISRTKISGTLVH